MFHVGWGSKRNFPLEIFIYSIVAEGQIDEPDDIFLVVFRLSNSCDYHETRVLDKSFMKDISVFSGQSYNIDLYGHGP